MTLPPARMSAVTWRWTSAKPSTGSARGPPARAAGAVSHAASAAAAHAAAASRRIAVTSNPPSPSPRLRRAASRRAGSRGMASGTLLEVEAGKRTGFTGELWSGIAGTYAAILEHPFVGGLTDGTLERETFRFYVIQDAHYLREYARALAVAAARAPREPEIAMFARDATEAIEVERSLHESFFRDLGVSEAELAATPMAPTNLAYTSYLLASAYGGSFPEALGAILPCYWIYWEVGEEFGRVAGAVIELAERLAPDLGAAERSRVEERFRTTARYEWMFWDAAWRR